MTTFELSRLLQEKQGSSEMLPIAISGPVYFSGRHFAPPGHNRDSDVFVAAIATPSDRPEAELPNTKTESERELYLHAIGGICDALLEIVNYSSINLRIRVIDLSPEPLDALLPASCRDAGYRAGKVLLSKILGEKG